MSPSAAKLGPWSGLLGRLAVRNALEVALGPSREPQLGFRGKQQAASSMDFEAFTRGMRHKSLYRSLTSSTSPMDS